MHDTPITYRTGPEIIIQATLFKKNVAEENVAVAATIVFLRRVKPRTNVYNT